MVSDEEVYLFALFMQQQQQQPPCHPPRCVRRSTTGQCVMPNAWTIFLMYNGKQGFNRATLRQWYAQYSLNIRAFDLCLVDRNNSVYKEEVVAYSGTRVPQYAARLAELRQNGFIRSGIQVLPGSVAFLRRLLARNTQFVRYLLGQGGLTFAGVRADPDNLRFLEYQYIRGRDDFFTLRLAKLFGTGAPWKRFITSYFGSRHRLVLAGFVNALPNTNMNQYIHRDTPYDPQTGPYFVYVFIYLDAQTGANGPTEFGVGTHSFPTDRCSPAGQVAANRYPLQTQRATPTTQMGEVLIFDGSIIHRGLANNTNRQRRVAYLVYINDEVDVANFENYDYQKLVPLQVTPP